MLKKYLNKRYPITFLVYIMFLVGCALPRPTENRDVAIDESILIGGVCSPPCWNGLTPGESTRTDVFLALRISPWVDRGTIRGTRQTGKEGLYRIVWSSNQRVCQQNTAYIEDSVLESIEICLYEITLDEIVDKYGPPQAFSVKGARDGDYLVLYYPHLGLWFQSAPWKTTVLKGHRLEERHVMVSPDLQLTKVTYFSPRTIESLLRDVFDNPQHAVEEKLRLARPWQGYGEVDMREWWGR